MIDFHSHIIPQIDDGSQSINESIEMLTLSKLQGINYMVATPHFYASEGSPDEFLARRNRAYNRLAEAVDNMNLPKIIPGAEVGYFEGMSDCADLEKLKIAGTSLIMVEMPVCSWSERMLHEIAAIYDKNGLIPLIAHIDRYIKLLHDKKLADKLQGLPVIIQANASYFTNKKTTRHALSLLSKEKIHLLGSDCHNITSRRPNLGEAFDIINGKLGSDAIKKIAYNEKIVFSSDITSAKELFI